MAGWFYDEWEKWVLEDERRDAARETRLAAGYRRAWETGDDDDRFAVLHFIFDRRDQEGLDLVVEGLRSGHPPLAREAAAITFVLIGEGFDMGPTVRKDLEDFGTRFPSEEPISAAALWRLDRKQKRGE